MTEKRYFKRMWGDEFYIFDSQTISEKEFDEKVEYEDYQAFADSMTGEEVIDRLNKYNKEYLDCHNDVLRLEKENEQLRTKNRVLKVTEGEMEDYLARIEEENKELKGKLEVYRELYPSGKWICDLNSDELKKELEE